MEYGSHDDNEEEDPFTLPMPPVRRAPYARRLRTGRQHEHGPQARRCAWWILPLLLLTALWLFFAWLVFAATVHLVCQPLCNSTYTSMFRVGLGDRYVPVVHGKSKPPMEQVGYAMRV